jgi:hypothetical protein
MSDSYVPNLDYTEEQAHELLGKHVLVGVTHRSVNDEVVSLEQFHGVVDRINRAEGMVLKLSTGEERVIPPDLSRLEPAAAGNYRLKATGEVVVDPDFTAMWTVYPKGYRGGSDV